MHSTMKALPSCVHLQRLCMYLNRSSSFTVVDQDEQDSHHKYGHGSLGRAAMLTEVCFVTLPACSGQTSLPYFSATF